MAGINLRNAISDGQIIQIRIISFYIILLNIDLYKGDQIPKLNVQAVIHLNQIIQQCIGHPLVTRILCDTCLTFTIRNLHNQIAVLLMIETAPLL